MLDLTKGLSDNNLTSGKHTKKRTKSTTNTSKIYYDKSYTSITKIPKRYCRFINSEKQCQSFKYKVDIKSNMRLICKVITTNKHIKALFEEVKFDNLHITSTGIYIDYLNDVGIYLNPRNGGKRQIRIFDSEETIIFDSIFDEKLNETQNLLVSTSEAPFSGNTKNNI